MPVFKPNINPIEYVKIWGDVFNASVFARVYPKNTGNSLTGAANAQGSNVSAISRASKPTDVELLFFYPICEGAHRGMGEFEPRLSMGWSLPNFLQILRTVRRLGRYYFTFGGHISSSLADFRSHACLRRLSRVRPDAPWTPVRRQKQTSRKCSD